LVNEWAIAAHGLMDHWSERGNRSADPYDGLAMSRIVTPERLPRSVRLCLVQLHKRSPIDLRPLFGIRPLRDDERVRTSLSWLKAARIDGGWAYPFDVQTKTHFYPRSVPNVVCTAFAAQAFLDSGREDDIEVAREAATFCAQRLVVQDGGERWFGYHPGNRDLIHNANLLAARLCALAGDRDLAAEGVAASLRRQRADGSFPYGTGSRLAWVDGHHTGFVVECLHDILEAIPDGPVTEDAVLRATGFYREHLFRGDGLPRQAPERDFPVDAIAGAQGIRTFAVVGDLARAARVARWMVANMRRADGTFVFHRGRMLRTLVPYARWCDAPMASALATLGARLDEVS
jgi:hypothetical protein